MQLGGKLELKQLSIKMVKERPSNIVKSEVFHTEIGDVFINDDGILVMRYKNKLDFELEKAKSAIKVCEEISGGKKMRVLIITGEYGTMPSETREYLASNAMAKHRKAVALIINNLFHRLVALFIMRMRNNDYPTQVFADESKAIEWLKQQ